MRDITVTVDLPDGAEPLRCQIPLADFVSVNPAVLRFALARATVALAELFEAEL